MGERRKRYFVLLRDKYNIVNRGDAYVQRNVKAIAIFGIVRELSLAELLLGIGLEISKEHLQPLYDQVKEEWLKCSER